MIESENSTSTHLVVCVHGLWGNPGHLQYLVDQLINKYGNSISILNAKCNLSTYTYDGIDICGDRLVEEIHEKIKSLEDDGIKITKFSIIGYSLGGLFSRYAIGILYKQGIFNEIQPWIFTTFATPHLGTISKISKAIPKIISWASPRILSKTGEQLSWIDKYDGDASLLSVMSDPNRIFFKALELFKYKRIYANTLNDRTVPFWTAAISEVDPFEESDKLILSKNKKYDVIIDSVLLKEDHCKNTIFNMAKYLLVAVAAPILAPLWISFVGAIYVQALCSQRRVQKIIENRVVNNVVDDKNNNDGKEKPRDFSKIASSVERENIEAVTNFISKKPKLTSASSSSSKSESESSTTESYNPELYSSSDFPLVPLIDIQRESCNNLNKISFQKYMVHIDGYNAHAEIVVRNKFFKFLAGKKLIQHFVEESFVLMESYREKISHILQKATILVGQTNKDKINDTTANSGTIPETLATRLEIYEQCKEKRRARTTNDNLEKGENISAEFIKEEHQQYLVKDTDKDINKKLLQTHYVKLCLETLIELNNAFRESNEMKAQQQKQSTVDVSNELLGVRDLRLIHTMLEIVISWGIYPCLMPGAGIPLSQRSISGFTQAEILDDLNKDENDHISKTIDDPRAQYVNLFNLMESLISIIFSSNYNELSCNYTSISQILLTRHLIDMYAALLQLAYGPMPKIGDVVIVGTRDSKNITNKKQISEQGSPVNVNEQDTYVIESPLFASSRKVVNIEKARQESFIMFSRLFERSDDYRSLESLMMLLGASPFHPAPNWLKGICGRLLTHILLKPDGVQKVIDFMIGGESEVNFSKQENISRVLLSVPGQMTSVEDYFSKICPQLLAILASTTSDPNINAKCEISTTTTVAAFTIIKMNAKYPALTKKLVINKLFEKLSKWWEITSGQEKSNSTVLFDSSVQGSSIISDLTLDDSMVMDETSLQSTIRVVHRILVGSEPAPDLLQSFLEDAIAPLYHLYAFAVVSKSNLREAVLDILLSYFRIVTNSDGLEALKEIVFRKSKRHAIQPPEIGDVNEVYFAPGPLGGSVMKLRLTKQNLSPTTTNINVDLFIDFLKSLSNNDLTGDFFMYLLNEYTAAKADHSQTTNSRRVLTLLHLVLGMIDSLGSDILHKPGQVIAFANNVLENYHDRVGSDDHGSRQKQEQRENSVGLSSLANIVYDEESSDVELPEDQLDEDETLTLALTLLTSLLAEHKSLSTQDAHILNLVFENLSRFRNHQSPDVRQMTRDLRLAISVRNAARASLSSPSSINDEKERKREESIQKYKEAMEALQDEILPVRASGLVILKEMILAKDPFINEEDNLSKVLDIFIQMIQGEESFIYLNAVRGLSSLAEVHGQTIMQKLMKWYDNPNENTDNRLRVGEAILQTIQRCGKALGKYITTLLPPLLHVLDKDQNEQLRVSSLSIIGIACQTSPYALSIWFDDLVGWILNILDFEKMMIEVRRASVVLLISLFRGLAVDTIQQIRGDLLKRAYISLRYIENTDTDDLTRYHARVCRSDLDVIVKGFLTNGNDE